RGSVLAQRWAGAALPRRRSQHQRGRDRPGSRLRTGNAAAALPGRLGRGRVRGRALVSHRRRSALPDAGPGRRSGRHVSRRGERLAERAGEEEVEPAPELDAGIRLNDAFPSYWSNFPMTPPFDGGKLSWESCPGQRDAGHGAARPDVIWGDNVM